MIGLLCFALAVLASPFFAGPGFHKRPGYVASWRPLYQGHDAIKIIGSPFKSFDEAEAACDAMLKALMSDLGSGTFIGKAHRQFSQSAIRRTTKIHALTDDACRPIAFMLTGGDIWRVAAGGDAARIHPTWR